MAEKKPGEKPLQAVADAMRDATLRYFQETSAEEMERQEAERDARIAEAIEQLRREGKTPPRQKKKG